VLALTRREGQSVRIGDDIVVTVIRMRTGGVVLAFTAPDEVRIFREELYQAIQQRDKEEDVR
jgi:carbon storage regulator